MLSFGQYIQTLRLKKGIAVQDISSYLDIDPVCLSKIEKGQVHATKAQVFQWASYFEVDVKDLLILYQSSRILSETKSSLINSTVATLNRHQNMMHTLSQLHESQIQVKLHKPSYPLSAHIESILYCKGHHLDYSFEKILPDSVVQLTIELDSHARLLMCANKRDEKLSLKKAWVTGIQKQHFTYQLQQSEAILYIRFLPGAFYALTHIPQSEIENTTVEADLLLGPSVLRLREELLHCTDPREIFQKVEQYFLAKISQQHIEHAVISYIYAHIHLPLSLLVQKTGYTQKHLIHLFKKYVGVTPKYFQRISRFNSVLNHMQATSGQVDWSAIAFDNHYYDQAHMIKEFSHFSGLSPQAYLEVGSTCSKVMHTNS